MIARAHPIHMDGRKRDLESLDSYLRGQGFPDYHGISTYPDGTVAVVLTNDHTDIKYGQLHEKVRKDNLNWDKTHFKDGRLR